jgi:hypothetical protein
MVTEILEMVTEILEIVTEIVAEIVEIVERGKVYRGFLVSHQESA